MLDIVKLGYIPEDCTEWSRSRPRRPFDQFCQPLTPNREPSPRCGYTSYTDRIRVYDNEGQQLDVCCCGHVCSSIHSVDFVYFFIPTHNQSLHFAKQGHEYFVVPPGDHFFWPGSYVGRKVCLFCFFKKNRYFFWNISIKNVCVCICSWQFPILYYLMDHL